MKIKLHRLAKGLYVAAAVALGSAVLLPVLEGTVFANGQVTTRSIEMSDSSPSASSVTYQVTFTPATSITNPDVIIDFCSNSPIVGDSCTATAGTDVPNMTSASAGGSWTLSTIGTNRGVKLTTSTVSFTSGTPTTITLTGVANPSATGSFYGRILTYASGTAGSATSDTPGSYTDYGGIALSTAHSISITAKVMETLSFCVYPDDNGGGAGTGVCGNNPDFTIGHSVGGTTVIDSSAIDTSLTDFSLSTNASGGAAVRLKGDTLKFGTNDINAAGSTATSFVAGTENFGVRESTAGGCAAVAPYNGAAGSYGLDTTATTTTYGDDVCSTGGAVNGSVSKLTWAATASNTTPAGVYTATEQLIATGTF